MKVVLLGGNGFIGEHLAASVRQFSGVELKTVGRSPATGNQPDYIQLDVGHYTTELQTLIDWADTIVILTKNDGLIIDTVLSALQTRVRPIHLVYISTILLYGESDSPQAEYSEPQPLTEYEQAKYAGEQKLQAFTKQHLWCTVCIVRLANVYGDVKNQGIIGAAFQALLTANMLTVNNDGNSTRDFIFIDDVVEYLVFLVLSPEMRTQGIVNVCTGDGYTMSEVIRRIETIVHKKIPIIAGSHTLEKKSIIGDNKKIMTYAGHGPRFDLNTGLSKTFQRYLTKYKSDV